MADIDQCRRWPDRRPATARPRALQLRSALSPFWLGAVADKIVGKLSERAKQLNDQGQAWSSTYAEMGPSYEAGARTHRELPRHRCRKRRELVVYGAAQGQGAEEASSPAQALFDFVEPRMRIYTERSSARCFRAAREGLALGGQALTSTSSATAWPLHERRATSPRVLRQVRSACGHQVPSRADGMARLRA